jgi:DNA-directed RNA polymerase specialized sigma24 family protein
MLRAQRTLHRDRLRWERLDHRGDLLVAALAGHDEVMEDCGAWTMIKLQELDQRQARIVEMHYFAGNAVEEIATALGLGERTLKKGIAVRPPVS